MSLRMEMSPEMAASLGDALFFLAEKKRAHVLGQTVSSDLQWVALHEYLQMLSRDVTAELEKSEKRIGLLEKVLKDICEEWNEGCEPSCNSVCHAPECKAINIAEAKRAMRLALDAAQAQIDRLMLEYCPSEMTREQVERWAASQRVSDTKIDTARKGEEE